MILREREMIMKYQIKSFSDPDPQTQPHLKSKDEEATEWLNKMVDAGYKLAGVTVAPYLLENLPFSTTKSNVRNTLTIIVEKIEERN